MKKGKMSEKLKLVEPSYEHCLRCVSKRDGVCCQSSPPSPRNSFGCCCPGPSTFSRQPPQRADHNPAFFSSSICYIRTFLNLGKCCLCKKHDFCEKTAIKTTAFSCYISAHILILQSTGFGARLPGLQLQPSGSLVM